MNVLFLRLNQAWRLLATGLGFVIFGVAGVVFKLILPKSAGSLSQQLRTRRLVAGSWLWFTRYLLVLGVVEAHFVGLEKLGRAGQLILANHPSLLDVVFLLSRVPEANCVVKSSLQNNPAMNSQIRACGYIPNEENEAFVEAVDAILRQQCLLIFPEGTRTAADNIVRFHRGAVSLGLRSARVITPVRIRMQPRNYVKGQAWWRIPLQRPVYEFEVGDDIDPQTWLAEKPLPIAARRLNEYLQDYFNEGT